MNITGKINIFVEKMQGKEGTWNKFTGTISHKNEDGTYINASIRVEFNKSNFPAHTLENLDENKTYQIEVLEGWLDCKAYMTKEGKQGREIFLRVNKAKHVKVSDIKKEDNNPFASK